MEIKIMGLRSNATFSRNFIPFHIFFSISTFTTTRRQKREFLAAELCEGCTDHAKGSDVTLNYKHSEAPQWYFRLKHLGLRKVIPKPFLVYFKKSKISMAM